MTMENTNTQNEQANQSNKQKAQKPYNLEPNVEAALAYFLTPITGVIVFMFEPTNKFVRFHAMQSILFGAAWLGAYFLAGALTAVLIGALLLPIVSIGGFVLWLMLMWNAYNNKEWELPYLGKIARDQISK